MAAGDITLIVKQVTKTLGTDIDTAAFITATELPAAFTGKTIDVKVRSQQNNQITYDIIATGIANA